MKKITAVILALLMIFSIIPITVSAGSGATTTLSVSSESILKTDKVDIYFKLSGNTQVVGSIQFTLFYDSEAFEYVSGSCTSSYFTNLSPTVNADGTLRFAQFGGSSSAASGTLAKLSFKPTAAAESGKTYEFGIGSKGRTTLSVTSSGGTDGDIISGPASESGVIVQSTQVKIKPVYTITYTDGVDGEVIFPDYSVQAVEGSKTPDYPGNTVREGYIFDGWTPAVSATVTGNVTYTAKWRVPGTFTVTYTDGVSGETVFPDYSVQVTENDPTPKYPGTPTREGYVFLGWNPTVAAKVTGNVTYTAKWRALEIYTVTYTDGVTGETVFEDYSVQVLENGATPEYPGTPTREGYVFIGWNPAVAAKVTGNVTYTAKWREMEKFTVKYTDGVEGETVFEDVSITVYYGSETPEYPGTPERSGYEFKGWNPVIAGTVTSDAVYTAVWEKLPELPDYTVVYTDGVEGENVFEDRSFTVKSGENTPEFGADPERDGYIFKGWTPEVAEIVTASVTYTAKWEKITAVQDYTVKYTDGVEDEVIFEDISFTVKSGEKTPMPENDPERDGYTFKGWNPVIAETVTANVTYTAIWERDTGIQNYTVVYTDGVDGVVIFEDTSFTVKSGEKTPTLENDPERDGYTFMGWTPEIAETVTASVTYTAKWEKDAAEQDYVVRYTDGVEGVVIFEDTSFTVKSGEKTPTLENDPERDGYTFRGWNPEIAETVTANVTYTARWEKNVSVQDYVVRYTDGVEGVVIFEDVSFTVKPGEKTPRLESDPERDGYTFNGWNPVISETVTANVTYTARWEKNLSEQDYVVRYTDGVEGVVIFEDVSFTVKSGEKTPMPENDPKRDGYTFKGWNPKIAETVTANVTYTASWEKNVSVQDYVVRYTDGVEGVVIFEDVSFEVKSGEKTPAPENDPVRDGYTFKGWNPVIAEIVTASVTYTARWEKNVSVQDYVVRYTDGVEDTVVFEDKSFTVRSGEATPAFGEDPIRPGYRFVGWNPETEQTVTASVTYTAVWERVPGIISLSVTYTDGVNGGTVVFEDQRYVVDYGTDTPAFNGIPTRDGYTFEGWSPEIQEKVTENIVYSAVWKQTEPENVYFTVIYTDGVTDVIFDDQTYTVTKDQPTPAFVGEPTREGYEFLGWNPVVAETVTRNVTYTATWKKANVVSPGNDPGNNGLIYIILIVIIVVLAASFAVCVYVIKKKKQPTERK